MWLYLVVNFYVLGWLLLGVIIGLFDCGFVVYAFCCLWVGVVCDLLVGLFGFSEVDWSAFDVCCGGGFRGGFSVLVCCVGACCLGCWCLRLLAVCLVVC